MRIIWFCLLLSFFGDAFGQEPSSPPKSSARASQQEEDPEDDIEYQLTLQKKKARRASLAWFGGGSALFLASFGGAILLESSNDSGGAFALVGIGTVGAAAALLGTSAGYFKVGDEARGRKYLGIQTISMVTMVASGAFALLALNGSVLENNATGQFIFGSTLVIGAASTAVLGGCTLWNLYNVGRSPRRLYEASIMQARLTLHPQQIGFTLHRSF